MSRVGLLELAREGRRIHFVGIGGAGMAALALLLRARGAAVSGSDRVSSATTDELVAAGIEVHIGHSAEYAEGSDALIHTAAVSSEHIEVAAAQTLGTPVLKRALALAEIVNDGRTVGVAGTHGKTTTTALTALALDAAGLDPTALVGGRVPDWGGNARIGEGDVYVVEADEYDRSFLMLQPDVAVVTSMEPEHLDTYDTVEEMERAFGEFVDRTTDHVTGRVVACFDDPGAARCLERAGERGLGYGLAAAATLRAESVECSPEGTRFAASFEGRALGEYELGLVGEHNVRNALAALGVMLAFGLDTRAAAVALSRFGGVDRRFEVIGEIDGMTVVDDYAHHPTEVRATLAAARQAYAERRLLAAFQPHLFSRTRLFADEFGEALAGADLAYVLPIYPAREQPIPGVDAGLVADAARVSMGSERVHAPESFDEAVESISSELGPGDVLITLGAGDVDTVGRLVLERLRRSHVDE